MKKTLIITILALFSLVAYGQNGGPLKFLGIPIDGPSAQFETKLKAKGFSYNSYTEGYKGQFNGKTVDVYVHTNHDIVDRVYVAFPFTSEQEIRNEFNRLLKQFNDTGKYLDLSFNEEIPAEEDISYEISVKNKRYQATFTYIDGDRDPAPFIDGMVDLLSDYLTEEDRAELKADIKKLVDLPKEEQEAYQAEMMAKMQQMGTKVDADAEADPEKALRFVFSFFEGMKSMADGSVWFMIHESYGRYNIGLYYDNLHNQAHGEDL